MNEVQELFKRQAAWQKSRQNLSWPEKLRLAQRMRKSILTLRGLSKDQQSKSHRDS